VSYKYSIIVTKFQINIIIIFRVITNYKKFDAMGLPNN